MNRNPYKIQPPFYVSFSGGRTSGFLLRRILDAWGGSLPDDGLVLFANTGKEHQDTLDFVHKVEQEWCPITWIEYRRQAPYFAVVDFDTADRTGKYFAEMIESKKRLPSPPLRFCTKSLKVDPMERYMRSLGFDDFSCIVGIRSDEPSRVSRIRSKTDRDMRMPLADDGISEKDVLSFWRSNHFDLPWPHDEKFFGNCDLCFLKSINRIREVMIRKPESAEWWIDMEQKYGQKFRFDRPPLKSILHQVTVQGRLFDAETEDTLPCDCTD
jgi:3'-phosphoadenosine 5'-phosphosulfate sulfotransferase (PAPS reductase)/FAD synthetase